MDINLQIKMLFREEAFPPMVLLNGRWGSGKTYFIKNELIPKIVNGEFDQDKYLYISLYGVSSLDAFKSKLVSALVSNKKDLDEIAKSTSVISSGLGKIFGDGGATSGILSGLSSVSMNVILNKIANRIIILDDLERVADPKVIKAILGECLNICDDSSRNVRFLFASNMMSVDGILADIEKSFSSVIAFKLCGSDVESIARSRMKDSFQFADVLLRAIDKSGFTNIRSMQRAISRFFMIYDYISSENKYNLENSSELIAKIIFGIFFLKDEEGFVESDLIDCLNESNSMWEQLPSSDKEDEKPEISDKKKKFDSLFSDISHSTSNEIISFCYSCHSVNADLVDGLKLPLQGDPYSDFIRLRLYGLSEEEFTASLERFKTAFQAGEDNADDWFGLYYVAYKLVLEEYIEKPLFESMVLESISNCTFFDPDKIDRAKSLAIKCDSSIENMIKDIRENNRLIRQKEDLKNKFLDGFSGIDVELYRKYKLKSLFSLIEYADVLYALKNWGLNDLYAFKEHVADKYNFSNIESYFVDDYEPMKKLISDLENIVNDEKGMLRKGHLRSLRKHLISVCERLEPHLDQN